MSGDGLMATVAEINLGAHGDSSRLGFCRDIHRRWDQRLNAEQGYGMGARMTPLVRPLWRMG